MKIRAYTPLVASGAVALVLMGAAVFFLVKYSLRYRSVAGELQGQLSQLDQLRQRDPFPSETNVVAAGENLARVEAAVAQIEATLAKGQFTPPEMEPAQFPLLLQRVIGGLNAHAATNGVLVPDRFAYGFERYARSLPIKTDIPQLARQLHYADVVARALMEAKVRQITGVRRFVFEDAQAGGGGDGMEMPVERGRRRVADGEAPSATGGNLAPGYFADPRGLFTRERMVFSLEMNETAVWDALNALARLKTFCLVSRVEIHNPAPQPALRSIGGTGGAMEGLLPGGGEGPLPPWMMEERALPPGPAPLPGVPPAGPGTAPGVAPRIPTREESVVAGRVEMVKVDIELDLYSFGPSPAPKEAAP